MARLLILNKNVQDIKPGFEDYKSGDIVGIQEDTHVWGSKEVPPNFIQLDLPGPVSDYEYLLEKPRENIGKYIPLDFMFDMGLFLDMQSDFPKNVGVLKQTRQVRYRYNSSTQQFEDKEIGNF